MEIILGMAEHWVKMSPGLTLRHYEVPNELTALGKDFERLRTFASQLLLEYYILLAALNNVLGEEDHLGNEQEALQAGVKEYVENPEIWGFFKGRKYN